MNEVLLVKKSLKDFFTADMLKIAIIPLLGTLIIIFVLFLGAADFGLSSLDELIIETQNGHEYVIDPNAPFYYVWAANILSFLLQYSVTAWLAGFLLYTVGTVFVFMFSIFITMAIIGFLTPMIVNILHKRHYSSLVLHGHGSLISPLYVLLKSTIIMIILFIVLIPLYFIPLINILAFNFPIYYFFHKLLNFDVASTMLNKEEYKEIYKNSSMMFRFRTLSLYILSMIPFITLFSAVFYIIYLSNAYFLKLEELNVKRIGLDT